jgi:hypothetical protein
MPRNVRFNPWVVLAALFAACSAAHGAPRISFEPHPRPVVANGSLTESVQMSYLPTDLYVMTGAKSGDSAGLDLYVTENGGDSYNAPVRLVSPSTNVMTMGQMAPVLLEDPVGPSLDLLYETDDGKLEFMHSHLFVNTFPLGKQLRGTTTGVFFFAMGLSPRGVLYVAWLDNRKSDRNAPGTFSLRIAKSRDHGTSFDAPILIDRNTCPCCRPAIAFGEGDRVYVAWRKDFPGNYRDVVMASSTDGSSFGRPVRVSADGWSLRGCPDSGPAIRAVSGGRVYLVWYTQGDQNVPQLRAAYTDDDGKTFSHAFAVSGEVLDPNHPAFVQGTDEPIFVFQGRRPSGESWSPVTAFVSSLQGELVNAPIAMPSAAGSIADPIGLMRDATTLYIAATEQTSTGASHVILERARLNSL